MRKILKNTVSSVIIYVVVLLLNIITFKLILVNYGSETNGLLSSVEQIFKYVALLEAGIGVSTVTALYNPLSKKNQSAVADVVASSRLYFRRASIWYFLCVILVSFIWPLLVESELPYFTIWAVVFFQGASGVITYWFTSAIVNYLIASGKNYVNNNVHVISVVMTCVLKVAICYTRMSVFFISIAMMTVNVIKSIFYIIYIRCACPELLKKRHGDVTLLKDRGSFVVHEISGVIFSGTDVIVISLFCSLTAASIYATYSMIFIALNTIIGQAFNGTAFVLGNSYAKNQNAYHKTHDVYNRIYSYCVFVIFTIAYFLIIPFIALYTQGVNDANYIDAKLPILFVLIQLLSSARTVNGYLIRIAYHAKQTIKRSVLESVINLSLSIILVNFIGIYGVLIGTIVALLYRTNDMIIYGNRVIMKRSPVSEYKILLPNAILFAAFVFIGYTKPIVVSSYLELIWIAIIVSAIVAVTYALPNLIVYRKNIKTFLKTMTNRKHI